MTSTAYGSVPAWIDRLSPPRLNAIIIVKFAVALKSRKAAE